MIGHSAKVIKEISQLQDSLSHLWKLSEEQDSDDNFDGSVQTDVEPPNPDNSSSSSSASYRVVAVPQNRESGSVLGAAGQGKSEISMFQRISFTMK